MGGPPFYFKLLFNSERYRYPTLFTLPITFEL